MQIQLEQDIIVLRCGLVYYYYKNSKIINRMFGCYFIKQNLIINVQNIYIVLLFFKYLVTFSRIFEGYKHL